jgi:hypothetical protein
LARATTLNSIENLSEVGDNFIAFLTDQHGRTVAHPFWNPLINIPEFRCAKGVMGDKSVIKRILTLTQSASDKLFNYHKRKGAVYELPIVLQQVGNRKINFVDRSGVSI